MQLARICTVLLVMACPSASQDPALQLDDIRAFMAWLEQSGSECDGVAKGSLDATLRRFAGLTDDCFRGAQFQCSKDGFELVGSLTCKDLECKLELDQNRYTPGAPSIFHITVDVKVDKEHPRASKVLCY